MHRIIFIAIVALFNYISGYCQAIKDLKPANHAYHYFIYGDEKYMELEGNETTYTFKDKLSDGLWLGFYDKEYTDTAVVAIIKNGGIEGYLFRWDKRGKYVQEIAEYKKGKLNGIRKSYVKIDGVIYENIYKYKDNILVETIKTEW